MKKPILQCAVLLLSFANLSMLLSVRACGQARDAAAEANGPFELTSGLGRRLFGLPDDQAVTEAKKHLASHPQDVNLVLALSKAEASRRQYREAVKTCTEAIAQIPNSAELYLERGHRELGLREFAAAEQDLRKAVELDPASLEAVYHLGLAFYFQRQFEQAAASFAKARALAKNDDSLIDCSNWLYVSLRRAGHEQQAAEALTRITPAVTNQEPHLLFYLRLLHFYQGRLSEAAILPARPEAGDAEGELAFTTVSYGIGNWHLYHGDPAGAQRLFRSVVSGNTWNAWGFIGSEVELAQPHR